MVRVQLWLNCGKNRQIQTFKWIWNHSNRDKKKQNPIKNKRLLNSPLEHLHPSNVEPLAPEDSPLHALHPRRWFWNLRRHPRANATVQTNRDCACCCCNVIDGVHCHQSCCEGDNYCCCCYYYCHWNWIDGRCDCGCCVGGRTHVVGDAHLGTKASLT